MSTELLLFLKAYLSWAKDGAPRNNEYDFYPQAGLCGNLSQYFYATDLRGERSRLRRGTLRLEFCNLLPNPSDEWDDPDYPFGGEVTFTVERDAASHHRNPDRISWIHQTLRNHYVGC